MTKEELEKEQERLKKKFTGLSSMRGKMNSKKYRMLEDKLINEMLVIQNERLKNRLKIQHD